VQAVTTVNAADLEYMNAIGAKYRELTGLRVPGCRRAPAGAFFEYGYFQFGVPSFSHTRLGPPGPVEARRHGARRRAGGAARWRAGRHARRWRRRVWRQRGAGRGAGAGTASGAGAEADVGEAIDLRLLQWMDAEKVDGFAAWAPFKHPTLGDVRDRRLQALRGRESACREASRARRRACEVRGSCDVPVRAVRRREDRGHAASAAGLYRIKADVENAGFLPTALAQGVTARAVKPVMVQLGFRPTPSSTGSEKTSFIPALAGSGSRQSFEWVIRAAPGTGGHAEAVAQKGGTDTATITLK